MCEWSVRLSVFLFVRHSVYLCCPCTNLPLFCPCVMSCSCVIFRRATVRFNQGSRRKQWATRLNIRSFARTACSALLTALIRLFSLSLTHSLTPGLKGKWMIRCRSIGLLWTIVRRSVFFHLCSIAAIILRSIELSRSIEPKTPQQPQREVRADPTKNRSTTT